MNTGLLTPLGQRLFFVPVIEPGVIGIDESAKVLAVLDRQELLATTLKFPETKLLVILRVIEFVPWPETIVVPEGTFKRMTYGNCFSWYSFNFAFFSLYSDEIFIDRELIFQR